MNDADGSVFIEDKDGNSVMLDGAGNITVKANKKVWIDAKEEIKFTTKNMIIEVEEKIKMDAQVYEGIFTNTASLKGTNEIEIHSDKEAKLTSGNITNVSGDQEVHVKGVKVVDIDSPEGLTNIKGKSTAIIKADNILLNC